MIIGNKPTKLQIKKIEEYIEKYIYLYPDYLQEEIKEKIYLGFTNNNDTINQIYCFLNIVDDSINPYLFFYKTIQNRFVLENKKILEIGAGTVPILAKIIKDNCNSKITLIDPLLICELSKGLDIKKEEFNEQINILQYDILIGYNPCRATEDLIKFSILNKKDFCVATCGCCFLPKEYVDKSSKAWHNYLIDLAREYGQNNYEIFIDYFSTEFNIDYPIISGKYLN